MVLPGYIGSGLAVTGASLQHTLFLLHPRAYRSIYPRTGRVNEYTTLPLWCTCPLSMPWIEVFLKKTN